MMLLPSIYDQDLGPLRAHDFSRPLFVQAGPADAFTEVVDVLHARFGLAPAHSTLLTDGAYRPAAGAARHLRHPDPQISGGTLAFLLDHVARPFSIVVVTIVAHRLAMRFHSNVACFCHALEPTPALLVTAVGQYAPAREFFGVANHTVGPVSFVANMLVSHEEAGALFTAAAGRPAGHVVEVGRFSGGTAVLLALGARQGGRPGIVSVDQVRLPAVEHFCRVNGVTEDVQLLDGDSQAVASNWTSIQRDPRISLLFVDADHSYDGVTRDLASWVPHVVPGGTIALHDSTTPDCGVARAIYHHLAGRPDFVNFRRVGSTVFCERAA
ncbi:MAG: class I SAM-dependent methyltransferase [Vicinamibacterales bacterium]